MVVFGRKLDLVERCRVKSKNVSFINNQKKLIPLIIKL